MSDKTPRIRFKVSLRFYDGTTKETYSGRRRRVVSILSRDRTAQGTLVVRYETTDGKFVSENRCDNQSCDQLLSALTVFVEADLLGYIYG